MGKNSKLLVMVQKRIIREFPGDRARMRHISHHPNSCSVRKRNTIDFLFFQKTEKRIYFDFGVNYETQKQSCEHVNLNNRKS